MREYGKINTRFWADTKMLRLTVNARFMVVYLLTGPHTNSVGCFRLPSGYISADLRWDCRGRTAQHPQLWDLWHGTANAAPC